LNHEKTSCIKCHARWHAISLYRRFLLLSYIFKWLSCTQLLALFPAITGSLFRTVGSIHMQYSLITIINRCVDSNLCGQLYFIYKIKCFYMNECSDCKEEKKPTKK